MNASVKVKKLTFYFYLNVFASLTFVTQIPHYSVMVWILKISIKNMLIVVMKISRNIKRASLNSVNYFRCVNTLNLFKVVSNSSMNINLGTSIRLSISGRRRSLRTKVELYYPTPHPHQYTPPTPWFTPQ